MPLFDNHGNRIDARAAYTKMTKMPLRPDRIVMLCLKAQILRRSDRDYDA